MVRQTWLKHLTPPVDMQSGGRSNKDVSGSRQQGARFDASHKKDADVCTSSGLGMNWSSLGLP